MINTPPERVSSAPFSSDEMQVSQHSSTAACRWQQEVQDDALCADEVVWLCSCIQEQGAGSQIFWICQYSSHQQVESGRAVQRCGGFNQKCIMVTSHPACHGVYTADAHYTRANTWMYTRPVHTSTQDHRNQTDSCSFPGPGSSLSHPARCALSIQAAQDGAAWTRARPWAPLGCASEQAGSLPWALRIPPAAAASWRGPGNVLTRLR